MREPGEVMVCLRVAVARLRWRGSGALLCCQCQCAMVAIMSQRSAAMVGLCRPLHAMAPKFAVYHTRTRDVSSSANRR